MEAHTIPSMSHRFEIAVEETRGLLGGGVDRKQLEKGVAKVYQKNRQSKRDHYDFKGPKNKRG